MKNFFAILFVSVLMTAFAFICLLFSALQDGPSVDTISKRVCDALMVSPANIRYLGGYLGRDPAAFFEVTGNLPEKAELRPLSGWHKTHLARLFNANAKINHVPYIADGDADLLYHKGDVFDLVVVENGMYRCVFYFGF